MPSRQRSGRVPDDAPEYHQSNIRLYFGIASLFCLGAVCKSSIHRHDASSVQNIYGSQGQAQRWMSEQVGSTIIDPQATQNNNLKDISERSKQSHHDEDQYRRQMLPSFDVIQKAVGVSKTVLRTKQLAKNSDNSATAGATLSEGNLMNVFAFRKAGDGGGGSSSSSKSKSKDGKSKSSDSDSDSKEDSKSKSDSKSTSKSKSDTKSKSKPGRSDSNKDNKSKTKKRGDIFQDIVDEMIDQHGKGGKGGKGGGHDDGDEDDDDDNDDSEEDSKQDGGKGKGKGSSRDDDESWYFDEDADEHYEDVDYGWSVFGKGKGGGHSKSAKHTKMTKSSKSAKASKGKGYYPPPPPPPPSPPTPRPPTRREPTRRPPTMRPPSVRPPTNPGPPDHGNQRIRYLRQKRKWNQYDIIDYDITTTNCGGMGRCDDKWRAQKRVEIRNGAIDRVTYAETGGRVERDYADSAFTVNLLYEYIGIALGRNAAEVVRTRYNSDYNYPNYAEIFDADGAGTKGRSFNGAQGWRAVDSQQGVDAQYTVTDFCDCNEGCCSDGPGINPTPKPTRRPSDAPTTPRPTLAPASEGPTTQRPTAAPAVTDVCIDGGGTVTTSLCCPGQVYPNTCIPGNCTCPPDTLETVPYCECEIGLCWNGVRCTRETTPEPTHVPTPAPEPTNAPTQAPAPIPTTEAPVPNLTTDAPVAGTGAPTPIPSLAPSSAPSFLPSQSPTGVDDIPTTQPPTASPSNRPSSPPSITTSSPPTVPDESSSPSIEPSIWPSSSPSKTPTQGPTDADDESESPSLTPTSGPTDADDESESPSLTPTSNPTVSQSYSLSFSASFFPSYSISMSMASSNVTDTRRHRNRRRTKARRQRRRLQIVRSKDEENGKNKFVEDDEMIPVTEEDIQLEIGGLRYQR